MIRLAKKAHRVAVIAFKCQSLNIFMRFESLRAKHVGYAYTRLCTSLTSHLVCSRSSASRILRLGRCMSPTSKVKYGITDTGSKYRATSVEMYCLGGPARSFTKVSGPPSRRWFHGIQIIQYLRTVGARLDGRLCKHHSRDSFSTAGTAAVKRHHGHPVTIDDHRMIRVKLPVLSLLSYFPQRNKSASMRSIMILAILRM